METEFDSAGVVYEVYKKIKSEISEEKDFYYRWYIDRIQERRKRCLELAWRLRFLRKGMFM
jgi:hypothetical protein